MNVENIRRLADAIEKEALGFKYNQGSFIITKAEAEHFGECGSSACIMGMASLLRNGGDVNEPFNNMKDYEDTRDWLGISDKLYWSIYYAEDRDYSVFPNMENVTKEAAVKMLRNLADTGEVNWHL